MKVICCSCGVHLRDTSSEVFGDDAVSHGFCESCSQHFLSQVGVSLTEYMESIPAAVVTVTHEGTINSANQKALALLGKSPAQIQGFKGGDVFECENARLPEGCGHTMHCSACTIRNTVMDTVKTGKPHQKVPAYLKQHSDNGPHHIELLISTEKKGGVVFLKVDEINEAARATYKAV